MQNLYDILSSFIPPMAMVISLGPWMVVYVILMAGMVGFLKAKKAIATPYTRKIFHFTIFSTAGILQLYHGLPSVILFGSIVSIVVIAAVIRGSGFPFYEALARESDRPRRRMFIIIPLITTALGGLLANLFFSSFAPVGYFVGGFGDAIGEPVGTKWGKNKYKVPSMGGIPAQRSVEGSIAVFIVACVAAIISLFVLGFDLPTSIKTGLIVGAASAVVEAISTHGLDNLTIQIAASGTAYLLLH